ncbi:uncharacterized protein LOC106637496, partial [Copidosoma floridanum]|uniref:uncharacterized protein LOC106637496 n=1 Tax=Copidosoma floridanum TaxID=29053 RepID=UPI0006C99283
MPRLQRRGWEALLVLLLVLLVPDAPVRGQDDDSLAGSFLSGLLDSLTSSANSENCPGVCVHALATIMCYDVLEDVPCPQSSMRCCLDSPLNGTSSNNSPSSNEVADYEHDGHHQANPGAKPDQRPAGLETRNDTAAAIGGPIGT